MAQPQAVRTQRLTYPALVCHDIEATIEFYTTVLHMDTIGWQPWREDPSFVQVYLDAGDGMIIAFVGPAEPDRTILARGRLGVGSLQHLALQLDDDSFSQAQRELQTRSISFTGPLERAFERILYVRDPNGITIELSTWLTPLPTGADATLVLKTAHQLRRDDGAQGVEDHHIQQALTSLYGSVAPVPAAL